MATDLLASIGVWFLWLGQTEPADAIEMQLSSCADLVHGHSLFTCLLRGCQISMAGVIIKLCSNRLLLKPLTITSQMDQLLRVAPYRMGIEQSHKVN